MATRLPPSRHSSSHTEAAEPGKPADHAPIPWWRSGWLWVAIGLLVVTLAAVVVTTLIAMDAPDPAVEIAPGERPAHAREANP